MNEEDFNFWNREDPEEEDKIMGYSGYDDEPDKFDVISDEDLELFGSMEMD